MNIENNSGSGQFLTRLVVNMMRNEANSMLETNSALSSNECMHQFAQAVNFINSWVLVDDTTDPEADKAIYFELATKQFVHHMKLMSFNDYFKFLYKNNRVGKQEETKKESSRIKIKRQTLIL
jgi:hypothetical protein